MARPSNPLGDVVTRTVHPEGAGSDNARHQARTALEALAINEEDVAKSYEQLAASRPERREEFRRAAEQARERARKVREDLRIFPD